MNRPSIKEEIALWKKGYDFVIGVDEVGRGAFAGPVVAGAVLFERKNSHKSITSLLQKGINDSKLLTSQKREILSRMIKKSAAFYSIAAVNVGKINKRGIKSATEAAFRKAITKIITNIQKRSNLSSNRFYLLADGFHIKYIRKLGLKNQKAIIKGDRKSVSIAAASIIAKVYRDKLMEKLDKKYPGYGFARNKGYGTRYHREALKKYGLSKIHRSSFNLKKFL